MADITIANMGWGCMKCQSPDKNDSNQNNFISSVAYIEVPGFSNEHIGLPNYE